MKARIVLVRGKTLQPTLHDDSKDSLWLILVLAAGVVVAFAIVGGLTGR